MSAALQSPALAPANADVREATYRWLGQTTAEDTLRECLSEEAGLQALDIAIARGSAPLIGELILAIRYQLARRLALREVHPHGEAPDPPSADQVCSGVFLRAGHNDRRVSVSTGAPS